MKFINNMLHILMLFILLGASSCGDGGSELADSGGIGGTGVISSGTVTDIGSVWVNGVRFDTNDAEVYIGDAFQGSGDQTIVDHLDQGRVVRVIGRLNSDGSGNAEAVYYTPLILGPINAIQVIDDDTTMLSILGQSIIVDNRTFLKDLSIDALTLENLVEVSGFFNDNSKIQGTFLIKHADAVTPDAVFRITGPLSGLDPANRTFLVNLQIINYNQAYIDNLMPSGIENGMLVSVSGQLEDNGTVFNAAAISEYGRLGDIETERIEIEGVVGTALQQNQFNMEGYLVEVPPATEFVGGANDDLLTGVRVEVEGDYSTGTLLATKINFGQIFRAESDLAGKDPADGTLTLVGLDGLIFKTNTLTRFSGHADSFDQLNAGDHLVIKGWPIDNQTVTTTQIIGRPAVQDKIILRGIVSLINNPTISINNVEINTDLVPADGFFAADGMPVSRAMFFNQVQQDDWVEIRGELTTGNSVVWNSITLVQAE